MEHWRALALYVKAIVVAVDTGIVTFETAFLPYMLSAGGKTVGEELVPKALEAASEGRLPTLDLFGPQRLALPAKTEA
jgi:hypothetical protein